MVIGSGGAGKSTFARRLADVKQLPLVHLDEYYWQPGWERTPTEEWNAKVHELAAGDCWVIDGNYTNSLPIRAARCDAIVFFDFPRWLCIWGVLKRRILALFVERPNVALDCPERLTCEFLAWIWNYVAVSRPRVLSCIAGAGKDVEVITVRSRGAVRRVLASAAHSRQRQNSRVQRTQRDAAPLTRRVVKRP